MDGKIWGYPWSAMVAWEQLLLDRRFSALCIHPDSQRYMQRRQDFYHYHYSLLSSLDLNDKKSLGLKYEPASKPLHICLNLKFRGVGLQGQQKACEEKTAGEIATLNEVNRESVLY